MQGLFWLPAKRFKLIPSQKRVWNSPLFGKDFIFLEKTPNIFWPFPQAVARAFRQTQMAGGMVSASDWVSDLGACKLQHTQALSAAIAGRH